MRRRESGRHPLSRGAHASEALAAEPNPNVSDCSMPYSGEPASRHTALRSAIQRARSEGIDLTTYLACVAGLIVVRMYELEAESRDLFVALGDHPAPAALEAGPALHDVLHIRDLGEGIRKYVWRARRIEGVGVELGLLFDGEVARFEGLRPAVEWLLQFDHGRPDHVRQLSRTYSTLVSDVVAQASYGGEMFTPPNLARLMVDLVNPQPGEQVYDPTFGTALLLAGAVEHVRSEAERLSDENPLLAPVGVSGVEYDVKAYFIGMARVMLAGPRSMGLRLYDALVAPRPATETERYDCVVAHPPMGLRVDRAKRERLYNGYPVDTHGDGLFLQHALLHLKEGGRAVIVVPQGLLFRGGPDRRLREWLLDEYSVDAVLELPASSLQPHSSVSASLLCVSRRGRTERVGFASASAADAALMAGPLGERGRDALRRFAWQEIGPQEMNEVYRDTAQAHLPIEKRDQFFSKDVSEILGSEVDLLPRPSPSGVIDAFVDSLNRAGIPHRVAHLEEVADVVAGRHYGRDRVAEIPEHRSLVELFSDVGLPLVRVSDVGDGEVRRPSQEVRPFKDLHKHLLDVGDVLFTARGSAGRVAVVGEDDVPALPGQGVFRIRPHGGLRSRFLSLLLRSKPYQEWTELRATGTTIQHVSVRHVRRLQIPVFDLEVQERLEELLQPGFSMTAFVHALEGEGAISPLLAFLGGSSEVEGLQALASINKDSRAAQWWEMAVRFAMGIAGFAGLVKEVEAERTHVRDQKFGEDAVWLPSLLSACKELLRANSLNAGTERVLLLERATRHLADGALRASSASTLIGGGIREFHRVLTEVRSWEEADLATWGTLFITASEGAEVVGGVAEVEIEVMNGMLVSIADVDVSIEDANFGTNIPLIQQGEAVTFIVGVPVRSAGTYALEVQVDYTPLVPFDGFYTDEFVVEFEVRDDLGTSTSEPLDESPYVVATPIDAVERPDIFKGRGDKLDEIRRSLRTTGPATVLVVEGNRRTGKTSLLNRLFVPETLPDVWVPVYVSLQRGEGATEGDGLASSEIFYLLARELVLGVHKAGITISLPVLGEVLASEPRSELRLRLLQELRPWFQDGAPVERFDMLVEALLADVSPRRVLLMIDEFDKVQEGIDSGVTPTMVPENLRAIVHARPGLSLILTGSRRIRHLRERYFSALYGIGHTLTIGPLDEEAARKLVADPVEGQLRMQSSATDRIVALCARRPFLIQSLCQHVFELCAERDLRVVSADLVDEAAERQVRDNEHFRHLWDESGSARKRFILFLLDELQDGPDRVTFSLLEDRLEEHGLRRHHLGRDLEDLIELELVARDESWLETQYRLEVPLFARWIRANEDATIHLSRAREEQGY